MDPSLTNLAYANWFIPQVAPAITNAECEMLHTIAKQSNVRKSN